MAPDPDDREAAIRPTHTERPGGPPPGARRRALVGIAHLLTLLLCGTAAAQEVAQPTGAAPAPLSAPTLTRNARWLPHATPPDVLPDGRRRVAWIYFGSPALRPPGADGLGGAMTAGGYAWAGGMLRARVAVPTTPYDLSSPVEGNDVQFLAAVDPDTAGWAGILTLGSPTRATGPVTVEIDGGFAGPGRHLQWDGHVVATGLHTDAREHRDLHLELTPREGRIGIRIRADSCGLFAATALALYAPPGARIPVHLDPQPAAGDLSTLLATLPVPAPAERQKRLTALVNWLHATAPRDGGYTYEGSWYHNAYAARATLAALALESPFLVPDRNAMRAALRRTMGAFLSAQLPDGSFPSRYFGPLGCAESTIDTMSRNLADVGSMVHALLLALPELDDTTRARGLAAVRRYADRVVLPRQLPTGALPNLRYEGTDYPHAYSVATATQAGQLAVLGALTGESRYRDGAWRAGRFLAWSIRKDGSVSFYPHNADTTIVRSPADLGDTFYILEGLAWVLTYARNDRERRLYRDAIDRALFGTAGLHASRAPGGAFAPRDPWTNSKMPAVLYILCRARALGLDRPELSAWIDELTALVSDEGRARHYGVMVDPLAAGGGFAMVATGFAGVGMGAACDPALLIPAPVVVREPKPKAARKPTVRKKKKRRR